MLDKTVGQLEQDKFLEELAVEMDVQSVEVLKAEYHSIVNKNIKADQWCQNMMLFKSIPQERAAKFLKSEHNIDVVLLPEPDVSIHISEVN